MKSAHDQGQFIYAEQILHRKGVTEKYVEFSEVRPLRPT